MRLWIVIAVLVGLGGQGLAAQTPEAAVEQAMRGYAAALWHRAADGRWRLARLMMQPGSADTH